MSLSDCPSCWETPCSCGEAYKNYTAEGKIKLVAAVLGVNKSELTLALHAAQLLKNIPTRYQD